MSRPGRQAIEVALGVECAWPVAPEAAQRMAAGAAMARRTHGRWWRRLAAAVFASALLVSLIAVVAGTADMGTVLPAGLPVLGN